MNDQREVETPFGRPARFALVSCVKSKHRRPMPAADLYTSTLFLGLRAYAEEYADAWYILSAKHGLLDPGQVIEPYEKTLNRMPIAERRRWAREVNDALAHTLPEGAEVIMLAGQRYREDLVPELRRRGHDVTIPLEGLSFGKQLQFLADPASRDMAPPSTPHTEPATANPERGGPTAPTRQERAGPQAPPRPVTFEVTSGRTLSRLTSRAAVLDAIAECDRLGRDEFLARHGFGPARRFFLEHGGRHYDSKAIVGVAFGNQFPDEGPLRSEEFSGGVATVQRKLEDLGFSLEVVR